MQSAVQTSAQTERNLNAPRCNKISAIKHKHTNQLIDISWFVAHDGWGILGNNSETIEVGAWVSLHCGEDAEHVAINKYYA